MTLAVSTRYGPYEIRGALSAGGMGEVYLARDTRLDRDVALKVLPAAIAADPDRRRRFVEEARATGALNHPNIVAIYDVNLDGEVPFLVTELVEGRTLRAEMDHGALTVRRALDIAAQVAAGLSAAHEVGIVHRDLKPENVMIAREGRPKIVDFGLAKVFATGSGETAVTREHTATGLVFGTVPYMSPEQAKAAVVDYRSDQFSLGVVLYEMLCGSHPFRRATAVQTLSAIIDDDATPIRDVKGSVPAPLAWIVERCLAKDPADRYASTADVAHDLAMLRGRLADARGDLLTQAPRSQVQRLLRIVGAVAAALVCALAGGFWVATRPTSDLLADRVPTPLVIDEGYDGAPAWSPDGRSLAYVSQVDGILQIFTRGLSSPVPSPLTKDPFDARSPFWSPDSQRVYFLRQAQERQGLWSVSVSGGEPTLVLPRATQAAITPDGRSLVFFMDRSDQGGNLGLFIASTDGGDPSPLPLEEPASSGVIDGWLAFSPDGSKLLVWVYGFIRPSGKEMAANAFFLIPWPGGRPSSVLAPLAKQARGGGVAFDWLPDNRHIVASVGDVTSAGRHLRIADTRSDRIETLTATTANESYPSVSRTGSRLAYTSEAIDFDLVSLPLNGDPPSTILQTARNEFDPAWSPDQTQFAFVTDRSGRLELWLRSAGASVFERSLFSADSADDYTWELGSPAFSPDGSRVAFQRFGEWTGYRIWIASVTNASPPVQLAPSDIGGRYQDGPTWSDDGNWIAYLQGVPGGQWKLVKTRVGLGGTDQAMILAGDIQPLSRPDWSPDGKLILFDSVDGLAVVPSGGGDPRVVSSEPWFAHTWSFDSRTILGLRESDSRQRHFMLVALDVATTRERVLIPDLGVIPPAGQPVRGLTRIGQRALATSIARARSDIYMLDRIAIPPTGWATLRSLFRRP
jgi:serine/threonine protein kinase